MKNSFDFKKLLNNKNNIKIVILVGFIGIILIVGSEYINWDTEPVKPNIAVEEYDKNLQKQITQIVSAITGESVPSVMLTLESTPKNVYATENKNTNKETGDATKETSTEEKYFIVKKSDGTQEALLVTEIQPEIKGIVIVSKYANNSLMRENIINAVKTVLNLPSNKVCVVSKSN